MSLIKLEVFILIILSISVTLMNCENCKCIHFHFCPEYKFLIQIAHQSESKIVYCNEKKNFVCCPDRTKNETISEKKCLKWREIEGFCQKQIFIRSGPEATPHEFPFMVLVEHTDADGIVHQHCGGVLIDEWYILTAAHCVKGIGMSVRLGAHNRNSSRSVEVTPIPHPNYVTIESYEDIALLKLHEKANITTKYVKPACLSSTNGSRNETFTIAGWGFVMGTSSPDTLLKGTVFEMDGSKCVRKQEFKLDRQICAGPNTTYGDVCENDSGGPLFFGYPGVESCLTGVVGVVSFGGDCKGKGSATRYTRISFYREWIESIVWPEK